MLVLALSMCFVKSKKIANNGDGLNTNIFTTFLLKKCLFIYTYWHFGSAKKPNFQTKKAPYIGICQFKVLLLRQWLTYRLWAKSDRSGVQLSSAVKPKYDTIFQGIIALKNTLVPVAQQDRAAAS